MSFMSLLCTACITAPAPRNNSDLNKAWVNRWKFVAIKPKPAWPPLPETSNAYIMYPICDMVE